MEHLDFFNHAGVAPLCGPAAAALRRFADQAECRAYVDSGWYRRVKEVKGLAAKLIKARGSHEIAFVANTTSGLALVARGLDFRPGDEVVITNVEYPANRYPWEDLARRCGVKLVEVQQRGDGRIDADEVADAITDRTRVVSISHVQYASGHRIELRPIADMVHRVGGFLCVDAIQSVGVLPVDVASDEIDFLSADGHKWMLGPEGCGVFYCREELTRNLHPPVVGWMNMVDADNYGDYRFELLPDARRFEPGSYNVAGIQALGASLALLLTEGIEGVWSAVDHLTCHLCDRLSEKGYLVYSPRDRQHERSGIVSFVHPDARQHPRIVQELGCRNIIIALREGRLRVSPHFYNTREQIDRLVEVIPQPG